MPARNLDIALCLVPPASPPARGAEPCTIPCGKCIGCRLAHSRQWAVRCVHEASLHERNCFLTLTFDDAHLPVSGSVSVRDVQLFLKRLRKALSYQNIKIRFFACGEYGDKNLRPHYHLILFNYDFSDDRQLLRQTPYGPLYISDFLFRLWPYGFHTIGNVTFKSCAYVARYVTKKCMVRMLRRIIMAVLLNLLLCLVSLVLRMIG